MESEPGWHLGYLAPEDEARVLAEHAEARMSRVAALAEPGSLHS